MPREDIFTEKNNIDKKNISLILNSAILCIIRHYSSSERGTDERVRQLIDGPSASLPFFRPKRSRDRSSSAHKIAKEATEATTTDCTNIKDRRK
jgi:hypothetical protein